MFPVERARPRARNRVLEFVSSAARIRKNVGEMVQVVFNRRARRGKGFLPEVILFIDAFPH